MSDSGTHALARVVAGRYRLIQELGRGGMGVVWLAEDQLVGRQVAVKELRPPQGLAEAERETLSRRALAEARSAARIHHPGAVTLYDVLPSGDADDAVYLIMELVQGPTLAQLIARDGPLPPAAVASYGLQLLAVLEAAHALGIVHRDIKPSNIIIAANGQAKLTDFGIAHTVGDARLTRSGMMGTRAYMAPELFEAGPISPAADVWSLGATLYCAAEGRGPFDRDTTGATLRAIILEDLPAPRCPAPLAAVLTAMLQRDPACRASISQASQALLACAAQLPDAAVAPVPLQLPPSQAATSQAGVTPPGPHQPWEHLPTTRSPLPPGPPTQPGPGTPPPGPPGQGRRRQLVIAIAVAAALVIAAAVAVPLLVLSGKHHSPSPGPSNPPGPSFPPPVTQPAGPPASQAPATQPAATLPDPGHNSNLSNGSDTTSGVLSVAYSPDGSTIAVGDDDGNVYLWNTATNQMTGTLTAQSGNGYTVNAVAFSPNGQLLAAGLNDDYTYVWNLATKQIVASLYDGSTGTESVNAIAFSPNSQLLAAGDEDDDTYLFNVASGQKIATLADQQGSTDGVVSVAFSPDGTMLAALDENDEVFMWNVANGQQLFTMNANDFSQYGDSVAFSPDGKTVAIGDTSNTVSLYSVANQQLEQTLIPSENANSSSGSAVVTSVAFSPDGTMLAAADDDGDVYLWDTAGGPSTATLSNPASNSAEVNAVAFAPDGKTVAAGVSNDCTYVWQVPAS